MMLAAVEFALKKLEKSKKDIKKLSLERPSVSQKITGVYLSFNEGKYGMEYVVTDDLTFAYQALYWIFGEDQEMWMKHIRYKTRQVLDEEGADSGEYWDEVDEEFKDELLKEFEFKLDFEGDEYEFYLMDLTERPGEPKITGRELLVYSKELLLKLLKSNDNDLEYIIGLIEKFDKDYREDVIEIIIEDFPDEDDFSLGELLVKHILWAVEDKIMSEVGLNLDSIISIYLKDGISKARFNLYPKSDVLLAKDYGQEKADKILSKLRDWSYNGELLFDYSDGEYQISKYKKH